MMTRSAEQLILEARKSPDLAAALELVGDTEAHDQIKFVPAVCRQLGRIVVCRTYATAILELCHLVVVAERASPRARHYEAFFWDSGPARPANFRAALGSAGGARVEALALEAQQATMTYPDGTFSISYGRMPLLSALMEFLVTVLGYSPLDDQFQALFAAGPTAGRVSATAKALSKQLYTYLNDHLGSLHAQRKLHALIGFLTAREGGDFGCDSIDDGAVLDFWLACSHEPGEGADFRTFKSALRACLRLRQAIKSALEADALAYARPLGQDRSLGEVDPADVCAAVECVTEPTNPLERLAQPPVGRIKFLTQSEKTEIELLVDCGALAPAFPLSILRAEVFGLAQGRITQALRSHLGSGQLATAIEGAVQETYGDRQDRFAKLDGRLDRLLLASLFVLVSARRAEAVHLILFFRPQDDLTPLGRAAVAGDGDAKVVALDHRRTARAALTRLAEAESGSPELTQLMRQAKGAFQAISRQGFRDQDLAEAEVVQGFAEGVEALTEIAKRLKAFCRNLGRNRPSAGSWPDQFERDRGVFLRQFHRIYGGQS